MLTTEQIRNLSLQDFRELIADSLAIHVKAYNLPKVCMDLGLGEGTAGEAHDSKRTYVKDRLLKQSKEDLIRLTEAILEEYNDDNLLDIISELKTHANQRISDITRKDLILVTNNLDNLFGDCELGEALKILDPTIEIPHAVDLLEPLIHYSLGQQIRYYYLNAQQWSQKDLLVRCHALTCTQQRFFTLLEKLLHPTVRKGPPQNSLAEELNSILKKDGFQITPTEELSGYSVYSVRPISQGVIGKPKNLIFASIDRKPDLYFSDAINNDIEVRTPSEVLIYQRNLSHDGLLWKDLVDWWKEQEAQFNRTGTDSSLYQRLCTAVKKAKSPGEYVLFTYYYNSLKKKFGDKLPALIPQVYLHYDPKTKLEREKGSALIYQRMDLLLLLENNIRIVIEVDGREHYSENGIPSPKKYAEMVQEDRQLRLRGYDIYRFGAAEFTDTEMTNEKFTVGPQSKEVAEFFFSKIFDKYQVMP